MAILRTRQSHLTVAGGIILLLIIYLSFRQKPLPPSDTAGFIEHKHALSDAEDIGLAFPYDPVPRRDFASLSTFPAHNINEPSKNAFATFYCDREPNVRGPYFEATQSLIWRLLWSEYRSKYPIIVFVCPFIPEENRRVLMGQGAIVKEIELLDDIIPDESIATKRWIDVLSKLNLWKEVEWKRLVFLDSDAFPIRNIDDIFDLVPVQRCKKEALTPEDKAIMDSGIGKEYMCDYVYAGVPYFGEDHVNAGMMILKPNLDMHAKLIRAARNTEDYNVEEMEQGVLKSKNGFTLDGAFPVNRLPPIWNALPEYYRKHRAEGLETSIGPIRVLHAKLWNRLWGGWNNLTELNDMWDLDWMKMCRFFDEDFSGFVEARQTGVYQTAWERYQEKQKQKSS
jgi:inositol 3-alpha-galactosyltransferase